MADSWFTSLPPNNESRYWNIHSIENHSKEDNTLLDEQSTTDTKPLSDNNFNTAQKTNTIPKDDTNKIVKDLNESDDFGDFEEADKNVHLIEETKNWTLQNRPNSNVSSFINLIGDIKII